MAYCRRCRRGFEGLAPTARCPECSCVFGEPEADQLGPLSILAIGAAIVAAAGFAVWMYVRTVDVSPNDQPWNDTTPPAPRQVVAPITEQDLLHSPTGRRLYADVLMGNMKQAGEPKFAAAATGEDAEVLEITWKLCGDQAIDQLPLDELRDYGFTAVECVRRRGKVTRREL